MKKEPENPFTSKGREVEKVMSDSTQKLVFQLISRIDLTVNPDFGQVQSDPSVMNLTAFERFYDERRPFFLEGSDAP